MKKLIIYLLTFHAVNVTVKFVGKGHRLNINTKLN